MPMYNLTEYNTNYSKTSGSLWKYDRDEAISGTEGNVDYSIKYSKNFDYKTSNAGRLEGDNTEKKYQNCCTTETFKKFLENTKYTTN